MAFNVKDSLIAGGIGFIIGATLTCLGLGAYGEFHYRKSL